MAVDLLPFMPSVIALMYDSAIAFVALVVSDRIYKDDQPLILFALVSVLSVFISRFVGVFLPPSLPFFIASTIVSIAVWTLMCYMLLKSDYATKIKVGIVGFFIYTTIALFVAPYLYPLIHF